MKNLKLNNLKNIINATDDTVLERAIHDIEERLPFYIMKTSKNSVVVHNPFTKALRTPKEYNESIVEIITL